MKKYKMIEITSPNIATKGVGIRCTDPEVIKWLLEEMRRWIPSAKYEWEHFNAELPLIGLFKNLGKAEHSAVWWIVTILCKQGWEPFSVTITDYIERYQLRYEEAS